MTSVKERFTCVCEILKNKKRNLAMPIYIMRERYMRPFMYPFNVQSHREQIECNPD